MEPRQVILQRLSALRRLVAQRLAVCAQRDARALTLPVDTHVEELLLHMVFAVFWAGLGPPSLRRGAEVVRAPSRGEACFGMVLATLWLINAWKKIVLENRDWEELLDMLLPCHMYNLVGVYSLLGTSRRARETSYNILLYCSWMPLLAMAFPDLEKARAIPEAGTRSFAILIFWIHHGVLQALPVYLTVRAAAGRYRWPRAFGGFAQYMALANAYIGVGLCAFAVATCRNANYSLWPPKLPETVLELLGGSQNYRRSVGLLLSYVVGPAMRWTTVPLTLALVGKGPGREAKGKAS